jgi:hypothetical protein
MIAPRQLGPQQPGKQMVIAIPAPPPVERQQEQVLALNLRDQLGGAHILDHRLAQRRGHPAKDRGPQQEPLERRVEPRENLLGEIVHQVAVVAGELPDRLATIPLPSQPQRRQLQRGRPPLSASHEHSQLVVAETDSACAPAADPADRNAATTYRQKSAGSFSEPSSDTHATIASSRAAAGHQPAITVVFPYPGGAVTSVKRFDATDESTSTNRGSTPTPETGAGGPSFVLSKSDKPATSPGGPPLTSRCSTCDGCEP